MSDIERIVWFELGIERKMEKSVGWRTRWDKKKDIEENNDTDRRVIWRFRDKIKSKCKFKFEGKKRPGKKILIKI